MKVTTIVDPTCKEEEVIIRVRSRNELSEKMERLAAGETAELMGFLEDKAVILDYVKVHRFTVEKDKIYAHCADNVYWVKRRTPSEKPLKPAIVWRLALPRLPADWS